MVSTMHPSGAALGPSTGEKQGATINKTDVVGIYGVTPDNPLCKV